MTERTHEHGGGAPLASMPPPSWSSQAAPWTPSRGAMTPAPRHHPTERAKLRVAIGATGTAASKSSARPWVAADEASNAS